MGLASWITHLLLYLLYSYIPSKAARPRVSLPARRPSGRPVFKTDRFLKEARMPVIAQLYNGFLSNGTETENQNGSVYYTYTGPTSIEHTIYSRHGRRAGNRARHRTKPETVARTGRQPGL